MHALCNLVKFYFSKCLHIRKRREQTTSNVPQNSDDILDSPERGTKQSLKRNGPLNVKTIEQILKRKGPLDAQDPEKERAAKRQRYIKVEPTFEPGAWMR